MQTIGLLFKVVYAKLYMSLGKLGNVQTDETKIIRKWTGMIGNENNMGEWEEKGIIIELRREWNGIENNVMGKGGNGTRKVIPMHLYIWPILNLLCIVYLIIRK